MPTRQQKLEQIKKGDSFQLLAAHGKQALNVGHEIVTADHRYVLDEWTLAELRIMSPYDLAEWLHAAYQLGQEHIKDTLRKLGVPAMVEILDHCVPKQTAPSMLEDAATKRFAVPGKPSQESPGTVPRGEE